MSLIKSKSRATHACSTKTLSASTTKLRRQKIGSKVRLNVSTGFMTMCLSELQRLRHENSILREDRSEIYLNASYMIAHS
jgi:hypothetical protein